jgi:hypothetical protein
MTTTTQMKNITMPGIAHPATLLVLATPAVTRNRLIHSVLNEGLLGRKLPAEAPPRCPRPAGGTGDPSSSYGVTYEVQGTSGTVDRHREWLTVDAVLDRDHQRGLRRRILLAPAAGRPVRYCFPGLSATVEPGRDQRRTPTASRYSARASTVPSLARLNCPGTAARSAPKWARVSSSRLPASRVMGP